MNNLTELVPLLDLCKQIPEGAFENSVLVWFGHRHTDKTMKVVPRNELGVACQFFLQKGVRVAFPAPTLAEILVDLSGRFDDAYCFNACEKGMYYVQVEDFEVQKEFSEYSNNPATAALKLWLEVQKI